MTKILFLSLLSVLCHPSSGLAAPLIGDLSTYRIDMDSSFNGTRIFLFGVRNDAGDVVMVIRGPQKDYIVRKKESIGGLWVNRHRMKLFGIPSFYAIAASKPLAEIEQEGLFRRLGIGEANLLGLPGDHPKTRSNVGEYADAFLENRRAQKLYVEDLDVVRFMGETLFKTVIEFPDNIPPGEYTAEMYLVDGGKITGMQTMPITVNKIGLDAWLYDYAHKSPAWYGLTAVVLALGLGWGAGRIFEKM